MTQLFAQEAIAAHNASYSTQFEIIGRVEGIYPKLQSRKNWDWVCRNEVSGHEAAVEVKRLTRRLDEQTLSELAKVGQAVCMSVGDRLRGIFSLYVSLLSSNFTVGDSSRRRKLVRCLTDFVLENTEVLPDGQTVAIKVESRDQLSEVLPTGAWLDLHKHDPAKLKPDSRQLGYLHVDFGWAVFGATGVLTGEELREFRSLIRNANQQLGVAKQMAIPETLLVLIETGFSSADPPALANTVRVLAPEDYHNINHIYLVGYPPPQRIGGVADPPFGTL